MVVRTSTSDKHLKNLGDAVLSLPGVDLQLSQKKCNLFWKEANGPEILDYSYNLTVALENGRLSFIFSNSRCTTNNEMWRMPPLVGGSVTLQNDGLTWHAKKRVTSKKCRLKSETVTLIGKRFIKRYKN